MSTSSDKYSSWQYDGKEVPSEDRLLKKLTDPTPLNIDTDAAWDKICPIQEHMNKERSFSFLKIAASFALLALVGLAIYQLAYPSTTTQTLSGPVSSTLPDGSQVHLAEGAILTIGSDFGMDTRNVSFTGKGKFEIAKDKTLPFIVELNGVTATVLGTQFYLDKSDNQSLISLTEGSLKIETSQESMVMQTGDRIEYANGELNLTTVNHNDFYWYTETLEFQNTPLTEVAEAIETAYGVEIQFMNQSIQSCTLTGRFEQQSLKDVLSSIHQVLNLKISKKGKKISFEGKGC